MTAVVEALPVVRGEALLRIIPSNLEVTASMKKQVTTPFYDILSMVKERGAIEGRIA